MTLAGAATTADGEKRLVKLLGQYARRSTGAGFGFTTSGSAQRRQRLLALVCQVDSTEPARITACVEAGADAVEVSGIITTPAALAKVAGALSVPWGIAVHDASFESWQEAPDDQVGGGPEWITLGMEDDARFLELQGVTKVLEVDLGVRPEMLRGVAVSGADVVVAVRTGGESGGPLTVADIVRLRVLCDVIKQPVLVAATLVSHDVRGLRLARDSGATGLLLKSADAAAVKALATRLEEASQPGA